MSDENGACELTLHTGFEIGEVDPRIFGGFIEHLGRCVYEGVYDPKCAHADEDGFRTDVMDACKRLRMTAMRYPGGNFASGYHWMDGVGPREERPSVYDLAWKTKETNQFGTDEFVRLCGKMDWTPMVTVNLGTGTPEEARDWVEYCNRPAGTKFADMRAANGSAEAFEVPLWCLGNEMDGKWQLGHVPADQYAIRAQQAAKMMKDVDQTIELVACGSCTTGLPTYMEWDREVLEYVGEMADYVSLHRYVGNRENDTPNYLAVTNAIDRQIEEMDAACRFVQAKARSPKRAYLCFDEWNVWYKNNQSDGHGESAPHLLEEFYELEDALVVAGFLNSFVRHADVLKIANIAQVVNVIAPIQTRGDDLLIQSIFYPFEMISTRREGVSLRPSVKAPTYDSPSYGEASIVDCSAILNDDLLSVFVTNRRTDTPTELRVEVADRDISGVASSEVVTGDDPKSANRWDGPELVKSQPFKGLRLEDGDAIATLPPLSFTAMTLRLNSGR